ncbi:MAG: prolipoprotein diacylglyceryl transferase [Ectothiorhodospiraceae bacterium]|nr:prolipoprotein diacylglyceryl transferase [Ectothiorhodospiraceae bacterium]
MIHWNVDPELITIGPFHLRWYGLLFALGFILAYYVMAWMFKREKRSEDDLNRLLLFMMVSTVIGARLGHCLFYEPQFYLSNPIEILKVWEGGLASHGAALGILIGLSLFVKRTPNMTFNWIIDRIAVVIPIAALCVRLGNLFNSEILGIPGDVPWAFVFERIDSVPRHPVQLYEAFSYAGLFFVLFGLYKKGDILKKPPMLAGIFLIGLFSLRFLTEFFKSSQTHIDTTWAISMGQFLSLPLIALGIVLVILGTRNAGKKPGPKSPPQAK